MADNDNEDKLGKEQKLAERQFKVVRVDRAGSSAVTKEQGH